ncbi:MAG: APA family basic amino acid/polyamine antiporter [Flavobacteriaceae bacterium]|jgi:APA family basic amino acid/polyamine antiporter
MSATLKLSRQMGLVAVIATGVSSMVGASINVVPFMIHRSVPSIGPNVLWAFAFAAIPALFAGLAYAILSSAMPRAGGSYLYASRGLNPYLGFVASFSQWFGLSIVIGVIAYISIPFLRDIAYSAGFYWLSGLLDISAVRVGLGLTLIWGFVYLNIKGVKSYTNLLIPMVIVIFCLGSIVILSGLFYDTTDFLSALKTKEDVVHTVPTNPIFDWRVFLSAAAILFSSFIGFDAIAQTGSEAKNPTRNLPLAILVAILGVGLFYFLFTASVYSIVPWSYVAEQALLKDITAPGLLSYVLPSGLDILILFGAAIALINDLPAMLLSVSRLMFAWAKDGIFPNSITKIHSKNKSPYIALIVAGVMSSIGVLGSHFAGDFFLGIDIMVTSMLVNFLLMSVTLLTIKQFNPTLSQEIRILKNRTLQLLIGWGGVVFLSVFLIIHLYKDMTSLVEEWYFHSTYVWLIVMVLASLVFFYQWHQLRQADTSLDQRFKNLPIE